MIKELQQALNQVLVGKSHVVNLAISCLLAEGHLLLEDIPGMGKTTLSQALAHLTGMEYRRVQFTSDLLPSELIGVSIFDSSNQRFQFHKGPIFSQLILADEINRASPKTQSALLEAMEEHQVTTDAGTIDLPSPFFVIATQNPINQTGTYPLPESQLDRFMMRLSIGYPDHESERSLLLSQDKRKLLKDIEPAIDNSQLQALQQQRRHIKVSTVILDYIQNILQTSRTSHYFNHGLSPRAGKVILKTAQSYAMINQRNFITIEDLQAVLPATVNHRLELIESSGYATASELILNTTEVPV